MIVPWQSPPWLRLPKHFFSTGVGLQTGALPLLKFEINEKVEKQIPEILVRGDTPFIANHLNLYASFIYNK